MTKSMNKYAASVEWHLQRKT